MACTAEGTLVQASLRHLLTTQLFCRFICEMNTSLVHKPDVHNVRQQKIEIWILWGSKLDPVQKPHACGNCLLATVTEREVQWIVQYNIRAWIKVHSPQLFGFVIQGPQDPQDPQVDYRAFAFQVSLWRAALHRNCSSSSFQSSSLCFLPPFLFRTITQVAEQTHGSVVASLCIQERAWLAVTAIVPSGTDAGKLCRSWCWLVGSWNIWNGGSRRPRSRRPWRWGLRGSIAWLPVRLHIMWLHILSIAWPLEVHILRICILI